MFRLFLCFALWSQLALAQNPESDVESQIRTFFDGMREADASKMQQTLGSNVMLKSILTNAKSGEVYMLETEIDRFIKSVTQKREGLIHDERILEYQIKIDGPMAMAWTPYQFFVNNRFIHSGVNLFTLALIENQWKIISITDTRNTVKRKIE